MPGEQLPPVVASLVGEDEDFLAMLDRDLAAVKSAAVEIEGILAGLDIGAAFSDSLSGASLPSLNTDEIAQGLSEGMGGVGAAIAQDLGSELSGALSAAGVDGGQALAEGIAESAGSAGDAAAEGIKDSLVPALAGAGAAGGQSLSEAFARETADLGQDAGARATENLAALPAATGAAGLAAGSALVAGASASMVMLSGLTGVLAARLSASADEAGSAAGDSLVAALGTGAAQGAGRAAAAAGVAISAPLDTVLAEVGGAGGDALAQAVAHAAAQDADTVAEQFGQALQASLETTMAEAGASAGDALRAGLESSAPEGGASFVAEFTAAAEERAEPDGAQAGAAFGSSWGAAAALRGVDLFEAGISTLGQDMGQSADTWMPHISIQPFLDAAADAAAAVEAELAASLEVDEEMVQNGIDNFLSLSDQSLRQWMAEVETAASSSSSAFIDAYSAINEQLDATTELTERQAQAMEYLYTQARAEMDALMEEAQAFSASIKTMDFSPGSMAVSAPLGGYSEDEFSAMSAGLASTKSAASGAEGALADVGKAAEGAGGELGGLGAAMTGPVGMGAMMLMSVLPLLSGVFDANSVSAATFASAVKQDSDAVGDNTATTIQQTLASQNLNGMAQQLGVSQATLIEYAAGESQAQAAVTDAYNAQSDALNNASEQQGIHSKAQDDAGNAADKESTALADEKGRLDTVTSAVQAAIVENKDNNDALLAAEQTTQIYNASVAALGSQMLLSAEQTKMQNQATVEYAGQLLAAGNQQGTFNLALDASYAKMQLNAQASSQADVGLLHLGDDQFTLNMQLSNSLQAYTEAQQGASGYSGVLQSLSGTMNTMLGDEASFTIALGNLTTAAQTNGTSLDVNTVKGATNTQMFTQAANAADQAATAVYQNARQHENADDAWNTANNYLEKEKDAFEAAAEKAGYNKDMVDKLANALYKLPKNTDLNVNVSLNIPAELNKLNSPQLRASGGPVDANNTYIVGEKGPELVTFGASGYVTPNDMLKPVTLGPGAGGFGGATSVGGASPTVVILNVEGSLVHQNDLFDGLQTGALQFGNRNSYGGLVAGH